MIDRDDGVGRPVHDEERNIDIGGGELSRDRLELGGPLRGVVQHVWSERHPRLFGDARDAGLMIGGKRHPRRGGREERKRVYGGAAPSRLDRYGAARRRADERKERHDLQITGRPNDRDRVTNPTLDREETSRSTYSTHVGPQSAEAPLRYASGEALVPGVTGIRRIDRRDAVKQDHHPARIVSETGTAGERVAVALYRNCGLFHGSTMTVPVMPTSRCGMQ